MSRTPDFCISLAFFTLLSAASVGLSGCQGNRTNSDDGSDSSAEDGEKPEQEESESSGTEDNDSADNAGKDSGDSTQGDDTGSKSDPEKEEDESGESTGSADESQTESDPDQGSSSGSSDGTQEPDPKDCPESIPEGPKDCDATSLEGKLRCIPGLTVNTKDGGKTFDLSYEQPVDHQDKSAGTFTQRLHLRHTSPDAPLILQTSGYTLSTRRSELAQRFRSNVLSIEHRFFNKSTPKAPADWSQLTIKNSADDFHRIYLAFKWLYPKPWVSTGASKGGETVLFHRRFHHCDVDGTVAYVAPLVMGQGDERFIDFLQNVGQDPLKSCRDDLRAFQRMALERRSAMLSRMKESDYSNLGGAAIALEHAVIELPFVFFQYSSPSSCSKVPKAGASDQEIYSYLKSPGQLEQFGNASLAPYEAYYYQAANELGTPGGDMEHLKDLLQHEDSYHIGTYLHKHDKVSFDETAMPKIQDWIKTKGRSIMLIYGGLDPWTAAEAELGDAKDSFSFSAPQGNHGATMSSLGKNKQKAIDVVGRWLKTSPRHLRSEPSRDWLLDALDPKARAASALRDET